MTFTLNIRTAEEIEAEARAAERDRANAEARTYLAETDWYVTRQIETGKAIPDDVAKRRKDARNSIT